jgi:hypothetical protein
MTPNRRASQQEADDDPPSTRPVAAHLMTTAACLLVLFALLAPNEFSRLSPGTFVSVPLEALLGAAFLILMPTKARPVVATLVGLVLGLWAIMKLLDMGFFAILARPFDPLLDWTLLEDGMRFLAGAVGPFQAIGCLAAAVVFGTVVVISMTRAVQRMAGLVVRKHVLASRAVVVLAAFWLSCALLGTEIVPGVSVAAASSAVYLQHRSRPVGPDLQRHQEFTANAAPDAFANTPDKQLLTALRGKDVIFIFVESYGRTAIEDPEFASQVGALLEGGNGRLRAAGFDSRSAFMTSPTAGGSSWLAHATFLSGLWIDDQQRYDDLTSSDRLTLTKAFHRSDWRTVGVMPGNDSAWPDSASLGYDQVYAAKDMGYQGPRFSWAAMPDQYTLSRFECTEHAIRARRPVMAEITLVSSHAPWEPIPRLLKWSDVGDGSVFDTMATTDNPPEAILTRNPARVRADYRAAIEYSLSSLISYVETYGDDNLVLIFLGDHQPSPIVTGRPASRDVPIALVARDGSVLERIKSWGWQEGLKPGPQAPVWHMDAFRDRFFTAFGAAGAAKQSLPVTTVPAGVRVR